MNVGNDRAKKHPVVEQEKQGAQTREHATGKDPEIDPDVVPNIKTKHHKVRSIFFPQIGYLIVLIAIHLAELLHHIRT